MTENKNHVQIHDFPNIKEPVLAPVFFLSLWIFFGEQFLQVFGAQINTMSELQASSKQS